MTPEELDKLIHGGEGPNVEFKREFTTELDRELVAFANTGGGAVLIGVDDEAQVVGVCQEPRQLEERIHGLCRMKVRPPLIPSVSSADVGGVTVVVVEVSEAQHITTTNDVCYVRVGSTTRRAMPEELQRLALKAAPTSFERTPVENIPLEDLKLSKLKDYLEKRAPKAVHLNGLQVERLALGQGFAVAHGEGVVATVAGALLFAEVPQAGHPEWGIGAVHFAGEDVGCPIVDRADLEGTLESLVETAVQFVQRNMRIAAEFDDKDPLHRRDVPEYPLSAVREALLNAVIHRDYSQPMRTALHLFDSRLEIANPGGLPTSLKLEELIQGGASYPRNPIIMGVAREWGLVEQVGRGLLHIRRATDELGAPSPKFDAYDHQFRVTMFSRHG